MISEKCANDGELLKVSQVATKLQVTPMTVYRLISSGELPKVEITPDCIRVKPSDVDAYIKAKTSKEAKA